MAALETFIHDETRKTPILVKAALAHAQFETIHPFLDGNGRVGRLLVTLLLCTEGILQEPLLYLRQHRSRYYELLSSLRHDGDWEEWIRFMAEGVSTTAESAVESARSLTAVFERDRVLVGEKLGLAAGSALRVLRALRVRPVATIGRIAESTGLSVPTVTRMLEHLIELGIVEEISGRKWKRTYSYREYLAVLNEGTES